MEDAGVIAYAHATMKYQLNQAALAPTLLLALFAVQATFAQQDEAAEAEAASPITISFTAGERINFRTDLNDTTGDISTARTNLGLTIGGEITEDFSLSVTLTSEFSNYDFGGGVADPFLTSSDAIENAYQLGVLVSGRHTINETWSVVGGGFTRAGFTDGADIGDAFTFGGFLAAGYTKSDNFSIDFGVLASSRLEDDALVLPYIAIRWNINEIVSLTSTGLSLQLDAKINDEWTAFVRASYESREYRLDEDFAPIPNGVVRDEEFPIGVGLRYSPNSKIAFMIEGGVIVSRELEFFDDNENDLRTIETDSGAFLGVRLAISF